jgi:hypothetical protein
MRATIRIVELLARIEFAGSIAREAGRADAPDIYAFLGAMVGGFEGIDPELSKAFAKAAGIDWLTSGIGI